jgi:hypothetical protein
LPGSGPHRSQLVSLPDNKKEVEKIAEDLPHPSTKPTSEINGLSEGKIPLPNIGGTARSLKPFEIRPIAFTFSGR